MENNQLAFSLAEKHLAISSLIKPTEMKKPDKLALFTYLSLFYELYEDAEPVELPPTTPSETNRELSPLREESSEEMFLTSGELMSSPEKSVTSPKKKKSRRRSRLLSRRGTKKSLATSPSSVERYTAVGCRVRDVGGGGSSCHKVSAIATGEIPVLSYVNSGAFLQ